MTKNIIISTIFLIFLISCNRKDVLKEEISPSLSFEKDSIFSKNMIRVYDDLNLNQDIKTLDLTKWRKVVSWSGADKNISYYIYESQDEELIEFYNLKFDQIEIKTINDSICELNLSVSGAEDPYLSPKMNTVKKEHIDEALEIFLERFGTPSLDLSLEDQKKIRQTWSLPDFSIEILVNSQKVPVFTPDKESQKEYDKIKDGIIKSSLKDKLRAATELNVKRSNRTITGNEVIEDINSLSIHFTSNYLIDKERKLGDMEKLEEAEKDSLKKVEARKKL